MTTTTRWTPEEFSAMQAEAVAAEVALSVRNEERYGRAPAAFSTWCQDGAEGVYYRRADGSHGWWHPQCGGLVQSG